MAKIFRKPRLSTVLFYSFLLVLIGGVYYIMSGAIPRLEAYLQEYQAAHINTRYQQIFSDLFENPDWGALYDKAGISDTPYEGKEEFIQYMQQKVGQQKLDCFIESNGTSGKKCPVYLDKEELAVFYMQSPPASAEPDPWYYQIPFVETVVGSLKLQSWEETGLTLHYSRDHRIFVRTEGDRIVYVNGVALTDAQLVSTTHTKVENYLPEGLHGSRRQEFYEEGFLVPPTVTVTDLQGNPVPLVEESPGCYTEVFTQQQIPESLKDRVIEAGKSYCRYMVEDGSISEVAKYFETSSAAFRSIAYSELWMQNYIGYRFGEPEVTEYFAYNQDLCTVRLTMSLFIERLNGTEKEHRVNTTFFLRKNDKGEFKIYDMSNVDIQATSTKVRLRFFIDDDLVSTQMVDANAKQLQLPHVGVPNGKHFSGWFRYVQNEDGTQALSLVFAPEDGSTTVHIPQGTSLTAMDLYARFDYLYGDGE